MEKSERESDIEENRGEGGRDEGVREKISSKVSPEAKTYSALLHTISSHHTIQKKIIIHRIFRISTVRSCLNSGFPYLTPFTVTVITQYSYILSPNRRLSITYSI